MKNNKVFWLFNIPSPYRVEFFNELTKYVDLTVAFELRGAKDRNVLWKSEENHKFKSIFMKSYLIGTESAYCPEVFRLLKENKDSIIVVGGYSTPTGMAAILYLRTRYINGYYPNYRSVTGCSKNRYYSCNYISRFLYCYGLSYDYIIAGNFRT